MRVHLIKEPTVLKYARKHAGALSPCKRFVYLINNADWEKPEDIKATFGNSNIDFLKGYPKVVIDIGGNNHRFICKYLFGKSSVHLFIHWLGTHAEYTELCDKEEQYTAENFKSYT